MERDLTGRTAGHVAGIGLLAGAPLDTCLRTLRSDNRHPVTRHDASSPAKAAVNSSTAVERYSRVYGAAGAMPATRVRTNTMAIVLICSAVFCSGAT